LQYIGSRYTSAVTKFSAESIIIRVRVTIMMNL